MTAVDDLTPKQAMDVALVQLCGLQVIHDLRDTQHDRDVVTACGVVLDTLLDCRLRIPPQRADLADTPTAQPAT